MHGSMRLGFAIAALAACGVLGFSLFGDRHEDWFLRAARDGAVNCLAGPSCTRMDAKGDVVRQARAPLTGVCAKASNWHAVTSEKKREAPIVVTCTDGTTYLFHMGKFRDAGQAQWMVCAEARCKAEVALLQRD